MFTGWRTGVVHKNKGIATNSIDAKYMIAGMKFVDSDGTIYTVEDVRDNKGLHSVYGKTEDRTKPDGWFTKDSYDVLVLSDSVMQTAPSSDNAIGFLMNAAQSANPELRNTSYADGGFHCNGGQVWEESTRTVGWDCLKPRMSFYNADGMLYTVLRIWYNPGEHARIFAKPDNSEMPIGIFTWSEYNIVTSNGLPRISVYNPEVMENSLYQQGPSSFYFGNYGEITRELIARVRRIFHWRDYSDEECIMLISEFGLNRITGSTADEDIKWGIEHQMQCKLIEYLKQRREGVAGGYHSLLIVLGHKEFARLEYIINEHRYTPVFIIEPSGRYKICEGEYKN